MLAAATGRGADGRSGQRVCRHPRLAQRVLTAGRVCRRDVSVSRRFLQGGGVGVPPVREAAAADQTLLSVSRTFAVLNGFTMKLAAPPWIDSCTFSTLGLPVIITTTVSGRACLIACSASSRPSPASSRRADDVRRQALHGFHGLQPVAGFADDLVFLVAQHAAQEVRIRSLSSTMRDLRQVLAHDVLLVFGSGVQRFQWLARGMCGCGRHSWPHRGRGRPP